MTWQEVVERAQRHRDDTIAQVRPPVPEVPSTFGLPRDVTPIPKALLATKEVRITESPPEELVASVASGILSSTEVTNAFLRRAGLAQKLVNCVTELLPERALARAKELDAYYAEHKRTVGPLHGLPISVKEHVGMNGLGLNAGFVSWWDRVADEDAHILKILWNAGCVFYVRTTQPQALMHLETSSNLYGVTVNPFNRDLTSGGSSGGEGALLGIRGSCLGIGSDIGGSIRSPAANCGVYGLRPTSFRLPTDGWMATMLAAEHIIPVIGPLSTSLEGIKLFMKAILAAKPWLVESSLLPFPWNDKSSHLAGGSGRRLKIGVLWNDGVVKPHPPVIRALNEVVERLERVDGVEIVDWNPYAHSLAWEIIAGLYFCDGAKEEIEAIDASGEPWRPLSKWIIKENPHVIRHDIESLWKSIMKREEYRRKYAEVWNNTASGVGENGEPVGTVDVILCPAGPGAAPPFDQARYWGYTSQWNLLDYPALVFPVTKVDPSVDVVEKDHKPMTESDEFNYKLYEPEKYKNAPVSLQLVGRRYDDEKVIEALEFITEKTGLPFATYV